MRLVLLALLDAKIGAFMTPFFAQSVGAAMRQLADMVNGKPDEVIAAHPEDFRLFLIGEWSSEDGLVLSKRTPELVCECANLRTEGK